MIDIRKLKELIRLMVENDLAELDLKDQQETVAIKRGAAHGAPAVHHAGMHGAGMAAPAQIAAYPVATGSGEVSPEAERVVEEPKDTAGLVSVASPMVGTVYLGPNPESPPFVTPGATVGPETTVCMIEAMKVFSEIKAETAGVVERVLVSNGQAVQFGQGLLLVRPG